MWLRSVGVLLFVIYLCVWVCVFVLLCSVVFCKCLMFIIVACTVKFIDTATVTITLIVSI